MNNNIETKEIIVYQRMSQVYKLTLNVPLSDEGMKIFYNSLIENLDIHPTIYTEKRCLCDIHTNDAINVLVECFEYCHEKKYETFILTSILSVFDIFNNLKVVSFEFIENEKTGLILPIEQIAEGIIRMLNEKELYKNIQHNILSNRNSIPVTKYQFESLLNNNE